MNDAVFRHAIRLQEAGRLAEAARLFSEILRATPGHFEALYRLGAIHFESGRFADAEYLFAAASKLNPQVPEPFYSRGCALHSLGRHEEALAPFARALALRPNYIEARNNRGAALLALKRYEEALSCFDKVLAEKPDAAPAHGNRAAALLGLHRHEEALAASGAAVRLDPNDPAAWCNRGVAFAGVSRFDEALDAFGKALAIAPDYADALQHRGVALAALGRHEEALADYDRALSFKPDDVHLLNRRCNALLNLKRFEDAVPECEGVLRLDPEYKFVRGNLLHARLTICDWRSLQAEKTEIAAQLKEGARVLQPLQNALVSCSEAGQLQCSRLWTESECPPHPSPLWRGERYRHGRIRVAFVSADLGAHAVGQAIAGLCERLDRRRFEIAAIALRPSDGSETRARLERAFERFIDAGGRSDAEIAALMREMEVDIAVDLMGFTDGARTGIFARRPAPVQVNYLGFPGTVGAPYMDYILADAIAVPATRQSHYSEKIVHLPGSYMPSDCARAIASRVPSRAEAGLPGEGCVFCSFNNFAKLNPETFDVWMRLLRAVEKSVLWLSSPDAAARRNLLREAEARGVGADRIVFAPFVAGAAEHLARLSLADLFLDTLPYNAHAGGVDALWAGVPVVSARGSTFAGRVGASLLHAAGLPELAADSLAGYEATALALARDPERLSRLRAKLAENRKSAPLFDTEGYARHLEAAFATMWERHARGEPPAGFAIDVTAAAVQG